jgi:hypothetical protein
MDDIWAERDDLLPENRSDPIRQRLGAQWSTHKLGPCGESSVTDQSASRPGNETQVAVMRIPFSFARFEECNNAYLMSLSELGE